MSTEEMIKRAAVAGLILVSLWVAVFVLAFLFFMIGNF
jgi:hypothetical protein